MIARVSTPSQGAVSFSRVLASQSSQLGLPASRLRIAHKSNMWIEGGNNPAQWGGLDGKKNSSHRKVFA